MSDSISMRYSEVPLDRASEKRKDRHWIEAQLENKKAQFVCLHNDRNLVYPRSESPRAAYIARNVAHGLLSATPEIIFLGLKNDIPYFAIDLSDCDEAGLEMQSGEFLDLRQIGPTLDAGDASLLAYARGLIYWHAHNHYCAVCRNPTASRQGGFSRICTDESCAREVFPRTDPAVIMLVEDLSQDSNPRCLLGRNKRFAARMFSTLAGFVEPGEMLEETVKREVFEEAGVVVGNVRYQASQPWPFPASIMLGFRATAESFEIVTDPDEIEEAYWFSAKSRRPIGSVRTRSTVSASGVMVAPTNACRAGTR